MLIYCILVLNILHTFIQILIIILCANLLNSSNFKAKATPTLVLFIYYLVVLCILSTIYRAYMIVLWRPAEAPYSPEMIYFLGRWSPTFIFRDGKAPQVLGFRLESKAGANGNPET